MKKINLIVNVKNKEEIPSLLEAGSDVLTFALKDYSMTSLPSFSLDILKEIREEYPTLNMAVLMNRVFMQKEMEEVEAMVKALCALSIQTIYFQDPSVLEFSLALHEQARLVYKPETLVVSKLDGQWWKEKGIQGVHISPLITLEEIHEITNGVEMYDSSTW